MIILGLILLVLGLLLKISILWTIGIIVLIVGADPAAGRIDGPFRGGSTPLLVTQRSTDGECAVVGVGSPTTAHSRP